MLALKALSKVYPAGPGEVAGGIRDATFDLAPGTFFTLLGPSGCGKTTTLRCIAGLEKPDEGKIIVDGQPLFDSARGISVAMHRRNIGMVFQSYAIWPHMTVFENVSFPMRVSKDVRHSRSEIDDAVKEALRSVGLDGYGARSATQLSGGQQQRVALARAIVHRPKLLLLDEPLSNLDAALRQDMRIELKRLQSQLGITAIYVTHDQTEALAMSDTIAVINRSRVVQTGSPWDIYFRPANEFVAGFIGHTNILRGRLSQTAGSEGSHQVELSDGNVIRCQMEHGLAPGSDVAISVRPENISLQRAAGMQDDDDFNRMPGKVSSASFLGNVVHYEIRRGEQRFQVEGNPDSVFKPGSDVVMAFRPKHSLVVPTE